MSFCSTWWGNKYVETIEMMDYNRMVRGRRYANNGSVASIDIEENRVIASVWGSRSRPYKVSLVFPKFSDEQKHTIIEILKNNPSISASLLNGTIPEELDNLLRKNKVELFVKNWFDVSPKCSCPDWAVPCKHLAAVLYKIALEIDKNPFVIFQLHNYDIISEMSLAGLKISKDNIYEIKNISDILMPKELEAEDVDKKLDYNSIISDIDFSTIPSLYESFFSLLEDKPNFSSGENFKLFLFNFYKEIGKFSKVNTDEEVDTKYPPDDEDYTSTYFLNGSQTFFSKQDTDRFNKWPDELIAYLRKVPALKLSEYGLKTQFWWLVYHFSMVLIKKGAFIPEIISTDHNTVYKIRWRAFLQNNEINQIYSKIISIMPDDIFTLNSNHSLFKGLKLFTKDSIKNYIETKKFKYSELNEKMKAFYDYYNSSELQLDLSKSSNVLIDKSNSLNELISTFIEWYFVKNNIYAGRKFNLMPEIFNLFFAQHFVCFEDFDKKNIPISISLWLSKFFLDNRDFTPIVHIEEKGSDNFTIAFSAELKNNYLKKPITLKTIMSDEKYEEIRTSFIRTIGKLNQFLPETNDCINKFGKKKIVKNVKEIGEFLIKIIPFIKLTGVKVLIPKSLKEILNPKLVLSLSVKNETKTVKYLTLKKMLEYDYMVSLGDINISLDEYLKLVSEASGLVRIKDQFVYINSDELNKMISAANKRNLTSNDILMAGISEEYNGSYVLMTDEVKQIFNEITNIKSVELPASVKAKLRPYQKRGFDWLYKNSKIGFGSILADDMGLGKTLQAISLIAKLKEEGGKNFTVLIIVPTTLLTNWSKEIEKFAPTLKSFIFHGTQRELPEKGYDIIITTYGVVRNDTKKLEKFKFDMLIIDEAQNIKNPATAQTKAVKELKAPVKIALSGTPVENSLGEYWSIFDFTNNGYLGNLKSFKENIAYPIEVYRDKSVLNHFKKITSPFIMRRMKNDKSIISDLPDKIETNMFCNLTTDQSALYESIVNESMMEIEQADGIARKGMVFKLMIALKQICNHPAQYLKKENPEIKHSGKASLLFTLLDSILAAGEKVLIFTQYKEMGNLLSEMINKETGVTPLFLHGSVSRKQRDEMVDDFQNNPKIKIFILSLKAGGTGLNLTQAKHVIHYDLWWNPAVESQATDRAYRIGQKNNVMVSRMICQGTFEEKIDDMIKRKKELAEMSVATGENWIGELSNKELKELFKIERNN